ncbi:MAG: YfcE family phosphodiesterase [Myxococcales bacterium]|jgi:putative phosphoesterase|nr:YfcE family phosphodiesterase [Myxococcales bacterium]
MTTPPVARIGVLSDSHGYPDDWVFAALRSCTHIIHAGDVQSDRLIAALQRMAHLTWVDGNMDGYRPTRTTALTTIAGFSFFVLHDLERLDLDPAAAQVHAVIHGHTHRPDITWRRGVLYLNPGSVSYPRMGKVPSLATIDIAQDALQPQIVYRP